MYDDLVKRLRAQADVERFFFRESMLYDIAADAIEELEFACNRYEKDYKDLCAYLPKWIPVSERLPKHAYGDGDSVLTVSSLGSMRVLYFDGGNWCYPTGEALTTARKYPITHWMPLPMPPESEET